MPRPRTSRRSSRRAARARRVRFLAGLATVVLALVAAAVVGEKIHRARVAPDVGTISGQPDLAQGAPTPVSAADDRRVYPYSIIEGGASTVDELKEAIERDPVVAEHFVKFDLSKTRVETLEAPRLAHVSYRQGNDVFWTRKKVVIPAGERVLTDGVNIARTRCGNCLSEVPGPVSATEPAASVLDTPISMPAIKLAAAAPAGGQIPQMATAFAGSMGFSGSSAPGAGGLGGPSGSRGMSGSATGGAGSAGAPSGALGLQAPGGETGDPGDPGDPGSLITGGAGSGGSGGAGGRGSSGQGGSGGQGSPGAPSGVGAPGGPQGSPNGPPSPPGNPILPAGNPIVPPAFQGDPGDPLLPPIDSALPQGEDPAEGQLSLPGNPGGPGGPGGPGDPGDPNNPVESTNPISSIPEPGTTALMLLAGAYVVRRIRRTVP